MQLGQKVLVTVAAQQFCPEEKRTVTAPGPQPATPRGVRAEPWVALPPPGSVTSGRWLPPSRPQSPPNPRKGLTRCSLRTGCLDGTGRPWQVWSLGIGLTPASFRPQPAKDPL